MGDKPFDEISLKEINFENKSLNDLSINDTDLNDKNTRNISLKETNPDTYNPETTGLNNINREEKKLIDQIPAGQNKYMKQDQQLSKNLEPWEVGPGEDEEFISEGEKRRRSRLVEIRGDFEFYGFFSILFGLLYTLFLYDNPYGIIYPLFVVELYVFAVFVMKHKRVEIKRGSRFLIGAAVLISLSSFFTGSGIIFTFNRWAIIMLSVVFVLHQIYDDSKWNIGKYMGRLLLICSVPAVVLVMLFLICSITLKMLRAGG